MVQIFVNVRPKKWQAPTPDSQHNVCEYKYFGGGYLKHCSIIHMQLKLFV